MFESLLKTKYFGTILEKLYHFKVPKKVKTGENAPNSNAFKLKTGLARDFIFVSSASRVCELKNFGLDF